LAKPIRGPQTRPAQPPRLSPLLEQPVLFGLQAIHGRLLKITSF
jgi:hypothetical protein